ncbi:uncharacterized protein TNCV_1741111 [Trichonephila clavipes]|uniref:Transposase n=1 Tax=Trichonephila clavipes TaxID=2585209 RepID=A0A8X6UTP5_TRICX|nr:uncharacterized protein TNCV_1741111 [Trichonephila clavipes]
MRWPEPGSQKTSLSTSPAISTEAKVRSGLPAIAVADLALTRVHHEEACYVTPRYTRDKPWSTLCKKSHGIPSSPRAAAVAKFRLLTGHDCLCAHLFRFNLVISPICVLCDTGQDMTAAHLDECSALNDLNCIVKRKTDLFGALYGLVESFFKNDEGHNVTVNGDRYRAMITNFFIPELNNHDVQELWYQQDGATCHTVRATIDLLKETFGDRLISRFGHVNWPPRSCDLTPLDYFLWGYVKSLVYADKPQRPDRLEDNIWRVIADIRPEMLEKVIENWTSILEYIRARRGSHMSEIIFKI